MKFIKNHLNCYYIVGTLPEHKEIKDKILFEIDNNIQDSLFVINERYTDNISKLDWNNKYDFERPWVKIILPSLLNFLNNVKEELEYDSLELHELWFQQYVKSNTHGWHTHSCNFTVVYYLEMDKESPKTELIDPYYDTKLTPNVKEGDVLLFPSFVVHKAPVVNNDIRKTIVSCNINYINPSLERGNRYNNDTNYR